jgi:integrase/recombinase XerD
MIPRDLCLVEARPHGGDPVDDLVERYVEFVAARCRPNTVAATRSDLGVFFSVIHKAPGEITSGDVLGFIAEQRRPRGDGRVVRLTDGEAGLSAHDQAPSSERFGVLRLLDDHRCSRLEPGAPGLVDSPSGASPRRAAGAYTPHAAEGP